MMGKMIVKTGLVSQQKGAALVVSLIMLLLMTLVGVTAMQVTTVQEKMVSNSRDLNVAFQAAETALKRGEAYIRQVQIQQVVFSNNCDTNPGLCVPSCSSIAASAAIVGVQCTGDANTLPRWRFVDWTNNAANAPPLKYGSEPVGVGVTVISPLPTSSVAWQPRYIIEDITPQGGGGLGTSQQTINSGWYRITAQGYGQAQDDSGNPLSRVMLQSVFKKRS